MQSACAEETKNANVNITAPLRAQESGESRNSLSNIFQNRTEKRKRYGTKNRLPIAKQMLASKSVPTAQCDQLRR
jgi:hypothetical protein